MHGETVKLIDAQQTKYYNIYKNTKLKLLKRSKQCYKCNCICNIIFIYTSAYVGTN